MILRFARKDEVETLQILNNEVMVDNTRYDPDLKLDWVQSDTGRKYFSQALKNPEAICLIAEENEKPIGYLVATSKAVGYRISKYIEIENMGVSPSSQSKGVGTQLINECVKIAKERGFQKVYVNTYFDNTKAVTFYERSGFMKIDISLEKNI